MHDWGGNSQEHADPTGLSILHIEGKVSFFDMTPLNAHHQNWLQNWMWSNKHCLEMGNCFPQVPGCAGASTAQDALGHLCCQGLLPTRTSRCSSAKLLPKQAAPSPSFPRSPLFYKVSALSGSPLTNNMGTSTPHLPSLVGMFMNIIYHTALFFFFA